MASSKGVVVIKIGGRDIDDALRMERLAAVLGTMRDRHDLILVHGGGPTIGRWQQRVGISPLFVAGLRVTDGPSLEVAEMCLSGLINKRLVARLVNADLPALGLSGVDSGLIRVEKLEHPEGDLGLVGRAVSVDTKLVRALLADGLILVISPISLGLDGRTYNVNADHAALALAEALLANALIFVSDVPGVLIDGVTVVSDLDTARAEELIRAEQIRGGMIPKVRSALGAVRAGVGHVRIADLDGLESKRGTIIRL